MDNNPINHDGPHRIPSPPGSIRDDASEHLQSCPGCDSARIEFKIWGKSNYTDYWASYFHCQSCSLVFVNPRVPAKAYQGIVENIVDSTDRFLSKRALDTAELRHNIVKPALKSIGPRNPGNPPAKWLDVGSAIGNLLTVVEEFGFDPHGVELNQGMVEWAANHRPRLKIKPGLISSLPPGACYDIVSVDNVLEHIHAPREFLTEIKSRMKRNSLLLIRVPNYDTIARPVFQALGKLKTSYILDPDAHPCNYNRRSLANLLDLCDFHPVAFMEHIMISYPLKHILGNRLHRWPAWIAKPLSTLYPLSFLFDRIIPRGGIGLTAIARPRQ